MTCCCHRGRVTTTTATMICCCHRGRITNTTTCRRRRSRAAKLAYILPLLPPSLSLCLSVSAVRCGEEADGGLSLFAKSTCNFRMFSRRPAFLPPKEIQWPTEHPSRSLARPLPSPPCLLFCAASLCKRYSRKIAGRSFLQGVPASSCEWSSNPWTFDIL